MSIATVSAQTTSTQSGNDSLVIDGVEYNARLLTGSGKYKDLEETLLATQASGAQIVTVAVRRTNIGQNNDEPAGCDLT